MTKLQCIHYTADAAEISVTMTRRRIMVTQCSLKTIGSIK